MMFWHNPLFQRELGTRLRSWKTLLGILSVAIVSSLLVLLRWPSDSTVDQMSQEALLVFRPLAFALSATVMMLVPAFPATSIVSERKKGTLTLLLNSPTTPWGVYLGKIAANVVLALILISTCLPALAACFAMGGISLQSQVIPLVIVLFAMALQYSAVGLWISIRSTSTDGSLRWTYAAVLGLAVLSLGPVVFLGNMSGLGGTLARWVTALSPLTALQQITGAQASVASMGISSGWLEFLIASGFVTGILSWLTVRKLDPVLLDRARPMGKVTNTTDKKPGMLRRIAFLIDPNQRKSGIPRWLNPLMVKEFRTRKFGRLHWLIRLVAICAVISLGLALLTAGGSEDWGAEKIAVPMLLMQIALLLVVGPSLGANLIATELESGGWQILRATPASPFKIFRGKLMSVVWTMLLVLLATLPGYAVMSFIQPAMSGQVGNVIWSLVAAVCMVVSISACVSAFSRSTAAATATSYAILLTLFAGTLLVWLARGRPFGPIFVERVLLLNPAAAALSEMNAAGFAEYNLAPGAWYVAATISVLCLGLMLLQIWRLSRPD